MSNQNARKFGRMFTRVCSNSVSLLSVTNSPFVETPEKLTVRRKKVLPWQQWHASCPFASCPRVQGWTDLSYETRWADGWLMFYLKRRTDRPDGITQCLMDRGVCCLISGLRFVATAACCFFLRHVFAEMAVCVYAGSEAQISHYLLQQLWVGCFELRKQNICDMIRGHSWTTVWGLSSFDLLDIGSIFFTRVLSELQ